MGRQRGKVKAVFEKLKGELGSAIIIYRRVNLSKVADMILRRE
jgi:hypothetical protein